MLVIFWPFFKLLVLKVLVFNMCLVCTRRRNSGLYIPLWFIAIMMWQVKYTKILFQSSFLLCHYELQYTNNWYFCYIKHFKAELNQGKILNPSHVCIGWMHTVDLWGVCKLYMCHEISECAAITWVFINVQHLLHHYRHCQSFQERTVFHFELLLSYTECKTVQDLINCTLRF